LTPKILNIYYTKILGIIFLLTHLGADMKLSTRSRYGVRLLLDLALHASEGPVRLGSVAQRQGIGIKYLEQIIISLKKADYVASVRGPKGGHMLTRPPEEITVGEVVGLLEGGLKLTRCTQNPEECVRSSHCVTRLLWMEATDAIRGRLDTITFRDLMNRSPARVDEKECEL
jgi:Rrf2 family protein